MMTTILTITSLLLTASFVGVVSWRAKKLPESISALVYALPEKWQWTWIAWMLAVSFTTMIPVIEVLSLKGAEVLGFVTLACLVFVSVMPLTQEKEMHYPLAVIAGIVSQMCVAMICPWWLLAWIVMAGIIGVVAFFKSAFALINDSEEVPVILDGKGVLLAEIICYVTMIGSNITCLI